MYASVCLTINPSNTTHLPKIWPMSAHQHWTSIGWMCRLLGMLYEQPQLSQYCTNFCALGPALAWLIQARLILCLVKLDGSNSLLELCRALPCSDKMSYLYVVKLRKWGFCILWPIIFFSFSLIVPGSSHKKEQIISKSNSIFLIKRSLADKAFWLENGCSYGILPNCLIIIWLMFYTISRF